MLYIRRPLPPFFLRWHERLCSTCAGAGEVRFKASSLSPYHNVWGCTPCAVEGEPGWRQRCPECEGVGFTPIRSLPPLIRQSLSR